MARNYSGKGGGSDTKYKKEYCQMVIDHMEKGKSFGSFAGEINLSPETTTKWLKKYPEFKQAQLAGHAKAQNFWETLAILKARGLATKNFDPKKADTAIIIFFLKTRFRSDYTEKLDIENHTPNINITYKEK